MHARRFTINSMRIRLDTLAEPTPAFLEKAKEYIYAPTAVAASDQRQLMAALDRGIRDVRKLEKCERAWTVAALMHQLKTVELKDSNGPFNKRATDFLGQTKKWVQGWFDEEPSQQDAMVDTVSSAPNETADPDLVEHPSANALIVEAQSPDTSLSTQVQIVSADVQMPPSSVYAQTISTLAKLTPETDINGASVAGAPVVRVLEEGCGPGAKSSLQPSIASRPTSKLHGRSVSEGNLQAIGQGNSTPLRCVEIFKGSDIKYLSASRNGNFINCDTVQDKSVVLVDDGVFRMLAFVGFGCFVTVVSVALFGPYTVRFERVALR